MEFAFEEESVPLDTLRKYIKREVNEFNGPADIDDNSAENCVSQQAGDYGTDVGFTISGCSFHVDSKYRPIGVLGEGSYGIVWYVINIALSRYTIKLISYVPALRLTQYHSRKWLSKR